MANGEQVARLRTALSGVELERVRFAATDWHDGAKVLRDVAAALAKCSPDIGEHFGGLTGAAAQEAFDVVHTRVSDGATQMTTAGRALDDAGDAIYTAQEAADALEAGAPQAPVKEQPGLDETPQQALNREARDGQRASDYAIELEQQERQARAIVAALEADYDVSTEKLKEIHGDPDPVDDDLPGSGEGPGGGGSGPPTGGPGRQPNGHATVIGVVHEPRPPRPPRPPEPPVCLLPPPEPPQPPPPPPPPVPPVPPVPPTPPPGTPPLGNPPGTPGHLTTGVSPTTPVGLSAGVTGGLAAGAIGGLAGGAVRGALASAAGGSPARPIGAGGRTGAPGALGRGGAAGAAGAAGTRGGAGSAGSPPGRGSRGGPGGAGGRGAPGAGAAGGRGRGTKRDRDDKDAKRDHFIDEDGWTDDEGAAPGVID